MGTDYQSGVPGNKNRKSGMGYITYGTAFSGGPSNRQSGRESLGRSTDVEALSPMSVVLGTPHRSVGPTAGRGSASAGSSFPSVGSQSLFSSSSTPASSGRSQRSGPILPGAKVSSGARGSIEFAPSSTSFSSVSGSRAGADPLDKLTQPKLTSGSNSRPATKRSNERSAAGRSPASQVSSSGITIQPTTEIPPYKRGRTTMKPQSSDSYSSTGSCFTGASSSASSQTGPSHSSTSRQTPATAASTKRTTATASNTGTPQATQTHKATTKHRFSQWSSSQRAAAFVELLQLKQGDQGQYTAKLKEYNIESTAKLNEAINKFAPAVFAEVLKEHIGDDGYIPAYMKDLPEELRQKLRTTFSVLPEDANDEVALEFGKLLYYIAPSKARQPDTSFKDALKPFQAELNKLMSPGDIKILKTTQKIQLLSFFHNVLQQDLLKKHLQLDEERFSELLACVNDALFTVAFFHGFKYSPDIEKCKQRLPESCREEFAYYAALSAGLENDARYHCAKALREKFNDTGDLTISWIFDDLKPKQRASILIHMHKLLSDDKLKPEDQKKLESLLRSDCLKDFNSDIVEYILRRHYEDKMELDALFSAVPEAISDTVVIKIYLALDFIKPALKVDFIQLQDELISEREINHENSFIKKFDQLNRKCQDEGRQLSDADMAELVLGLFMQIDVYLKNAEKKSVGTKHSDLLKQVHAVRLELDGVLVSYSLQAEFRQAIIRHALASEVGIEEYTSYVLPTHRANLHAEAQSAQKAQTSDKTQPAKASEVMVGDQADVVKAVTKTKRDVDAASQKQAKITDLKTRIENTLKRLGCYVTPSKKKLTYSVIALRDPDLKCQLLDDLYELQRLGDTSFMEKAEFNKTFSAYKKGLVTHAIDSYFETSRLPAYISQFSLQEFKRFLCVARLLPDSREYIGNLMTDKVIPGGAKHDYNKLLPIFARVLYDFSEDVEQSLAGKLERHQLHVHERVIIASLFYRENFRTDLKLYDENLLEKFNEIYESFKFDIYLWAIEAIYIQKIDKQEIRDCLSEPLTSQLEGYLHADRFLPNTSNTVKYAYCSFILQVMRKQATSDKNDPAAKFSTVDYLIKLPFDERVQLILQIKRELLANSYPDGMQQALQAEFDNNIKTRFDGNIETYLIARHFEKGLALEKTNIASLIDGASEKMLASVRYRGGLTNVPIAPKLRIYLLRIRECLYNGNMLVPESKEIKRSFENLRHPVTNKDAKLTTAQQAELLLGLYISVDSIGDKDERFNTEIRKQTCLDRLDDLKEHFNLQEDFHAFIINAALVFAKDKESFFEKVLKFVLPRARKQLREKFEARLKARHAKQEADVAAEQEKDMLLAEGFSTVVERADGQAGDPSDSDDLRSSGSSKTVFFETGGSAADADKASASQVEHAKPAACQAERKRATGENIPEGASTTTAPRDWGAIMDDAVRKSQAPKDGSTVLAATGSATSPKGPR